MIVWFNGNLKVVYVMLLMPAGKYVAQNVQHDSIHFGVEVLV